MIPSHYHDDHLAGLPWLQQTQGTQAWIFENFADIVSNPAGYNIPCLLPQPIRVDRALPDRGRVSWDRWTFDVFHMPGHTWWALGLFGEIDGTRVAFTGDNLLQGAVSPLRAAAPVYRNKMLVRLDRGRRPAPHGVRAGAAAHRAHRARLRVDRKMLEDFHGWARQLEGVFQTLVAVPAEVNFALDPNFATSIPTGTRPRPGDRLTLELRVTNHGAREATAPREPGRAGRVVRLARRGRGRHRGRARAACSASWSRCRREPRAGTSSARSSRSASVASVRSRRRSSTWPEPWIALRDARPSSASMPRTVALKGPRTG